MIVSIVLFSSLITLVITAFQLLSEYRDGVDQVKRQIVQIETLSLPTLTESLWNLYEKQVQSQLDDLVNYPDLQYLEIRSRGDVVFASGVPQTSTDTITEMLPLVYSNDYKSIPIGELMVVATLGNVYQGIYDRALMILVSNAFKTALVSIFIFFLFQFLVTRHLISVSNFLRDFSLGGADAKLNLDRKYDEDELGQMVDTINRLTTNLTKLHNELEERVEERTADLRRVQEDLLKKERLAVLGELTGTVAHELRNPLATITTSAKVMELKLEGSDIDVGPAIDRVRRNVERCNNIITELLDFARAKGLNPQPTTLDSWLSEVLSEMRYPECIAVRCDLNTPDIDIAFDRERIRSAVINLMNNACDAITTEGPEVENGTIDVSTRVAEQRVEIEVSDNGSGIPDDLMLRVYEPLFSTKSFGVGLGLPIVHRVMQEHGGGMVINSLDGQGTQATIWLPLRNPDAIGDRNTRTC